MTGNLSESARELLAEATQFDGTPPISDQALLAVFQGKRSLIEFEGDAIGIIGEGELDLVVRPGKRGRGVGARALQRLLQHKDRAHSNELRAWAHGENPAATALLRGAGFTPVRTLLRMSLNPALLSTAITNARPLDNQFELRSYDPENSQQADDWVRVNAAAFSNHPEQGSMTRKDFDALTREPWFLADDLRLAYRVHTTGSDRDELAAFAWVKTTKNGALTETELYALAVAPEAAGCGLGAAMMGETLRRMATHSPDRITLYVEGDNDQALPLYERAGFEVEQRSMQWLVKSR